MGRGSGIREVAWLDIAGGGQVVPDNHAYISHMDAPHGISILDVSGSRQPPHHRRDRHPSRPALHKVSVSNDLMLVNRERCRGDKPPRDFVGLRIFDVSNPSNPRRICH